ncbi:MAG TPA: hypothetical protein VL358_00080 [Caulobacteraceae bacterium]|jgi:hypothetical protein|nr:hypothetical protein [Caulobacteraceae bacterium]
MRIPGFPRRDRQTSEDLATDGVYVERRPGESTEAFETRLAAAAQEREGGRPFARPIRPVADRRDGGRRTEAPRSRRRHGFGMVGLAVTLVAVLGVLWMVLAAREGSFAGGGAVVDQKIAEVTAPAKVAASQAVDRTGQAVQNAGQAIEHQGEKIRKTAN